MGGSSRARRVRLDTVEATGSIQYRPPAKMAWSRRRLPAPMQPQALARGVRPPVPAPRGRTHPSRYVDDMQRYNLWKRPPFNNGGSKFD